MEQQPKKRTGWKRAGRIALKTILGIFFLIVIVFLLVLTPPVQNFIRKKVVAYLENKLDTKVAIGRIYIGLPRDIVLEDIYIEDRQKDTLLSGGKLMADLNIWRLITKNDVILKHVTLNDITAKIKRQLPDTSFNFQFIIDAFAPTDTAASASSSTSSGITLGTIELNRIRVLYKDTLTGSDMEASLDHLFTNVRDFDQDRLHFDIPEINISGLVARVYQVKPLATPEPASIDRIEASQPKTMQLVLKTIKLQKIKLDYRNDVSAFYTTLDIGKFNVTTNSIDLNKRVIDLDDVLLEDAIASIRLGRNEQAKIVEKEVEQEVETQAEAGWKISAGNLNLQNNDLRFNNDNTPKISHGMDYAHLHAQQFTLQAKNIIIAPDTIAGTIGKGSFKEQSGFVLNVLQTDFLYTPRESYLHDLFLQTPGTTLQRNAAIKYASIESLANDIGNMEVDLDIDQSKVLVRDVLTFAPMLRQQPAFADPNAVWHINSRVTGRVSDLNIKALQVRSLQDTKLDVSGNIAGMPSMKKMSADLTIRNFSSSKRDISRFIPKKSLPSNITLPNNIHVKGTLKGNSSRMNTDLSLGTDLGNAMITGSFSEFDNPVNMGYNAKIESHSLNLGTLLQNNKIPGSFTATITVNGKGLDPKTANSQVNAVIKSAVMNGYNYRDVKLNGYIRNQVANFDASAIDPNIHFTMNLVADVSKEFPAIQARGMIDSIKLQALHFTKEKLIYHGKVDANFPVTNPDDLQGKLTLTESVFVQNDQRITLDTLQLAAARSDSGRYLQLASPVMTARLEGKYRLTQLGAVLQQAVQPYFAVAGNSNNARLEPYDFTINAYVLDNPALKVFVPGLTQLDSVSLQAHFSSENSWKASLKAPYIEMGPNRLRNLNLQASTTSDAIQMQTTVENISSGSNLALDNATINASIANNTIDFGLNIKDKSLKDIYNINGLLEQPRNGYYQLALKPDSLLLNYDTWTVAADNRILFGPQGINATNFELSKNGQRLTINSLNENPNAPLDVNFENFKLATLTGFIQTDSTFANGLLNGKITFNELSNEPVFIGDLSVNDLSLRGDTVGNVRMLVNNRVPGTYSADVTLSGRGNDVKLAGNYYLKAGDSNFDFDLDIRQMPMATVSAFSDEMIRDATGSASGKFDITGTITKPVVRGDLNFNKARFNFSMLNSYFSIDQEKIRIDESAIVFNNFEIKDTSQNTLQIDGLAGTSNFVNYNFDLKIRARDFQALNSTKRDNKLFYGQLFFNTNLQVKGTEKAPAIDGRLVVNDKTKMTVVLPQNEPGVVQREGVVEFVDMDATLTDSLFMAPYDSLNTAPYTGMDISLNVEIDKEAEFNLIVDEGNGDFLNVKGEAQLTAGIDPSGKINMAGTYELEQGSYELTFNFVRRKFDIEKGSRIVWEGEPTDARVELEAVYVANAAPLDLVKSQLEEASAFQRNTYMQKLPFDVHLKMEGELLKPLISFDIILPEDKKYAVSGEILTTVRNRLDQLRQETGEMNKQVFSLLLLNRFVAENPFDASGDAFNAGVLARQSVSKLLTEQLNRLADDLVAGVDLNFDVLSSEDYTTGERRDRTDLNVGLSKQLLNDRLKVSVGSNFELEGPSGSNQQSNNIAGDIALDYSISRDNRYLLRAYRKNEYQGVIDGYIIETGVGFIITVDYNRFRELFISKRERDQRRQRRQKQREIEEQQKEEQQNKTGTATPVNN